MVAWKNYFPDLSGPPGGVGAMIRIVPTTTSGPRRAGYDSLYGARFTSPGVVDANAASRIGYGVLDDSDDLAGPLLSGSAGFTFDAGDVALLGSGQGLAATLFVAPASAFAPGVVPTPQQIVDARIRMVRGRGAFGSPVYRTTAGAMDLMFLSDVDFDLSDMPNTKLWMCACPTVIRYDLEPTDPTFTDIPIGGANAHGRAVSVWTNRTPEAPEITMPSARVFALPGTVLDFAFLPKDPDRVASFFGDLSISSVYEDMAGIQIQYAPVPTDDDPDPEWTDVPVGNYTDGGLGPGWFIDGSTNLFDPAEAATRIIWANRKTKIRCATQDQSEPGHIYLPSGDWQLRMRVFDQGHNAPGDWLAVPRQGANPPLGVPDPLGGWFFNTHPDTYPSVNTSPWSEKIYISISAQVPKPVALSPFNNIAISEGAPVTLVWQYRNTYSPPYPQAFRTVQIREVGGEWTDLVTEQASDSESLSVSGFDLVSGNQYEWRVQVEDTSGAVSEFSDSAFFWVVPVPDSGAVIPTPSETTDGGTLGCGEHTVKIYRRGGLTPVGTLRGVQRLEWNRLRDDISDARIVIRDWDVDCGELLGRLVPWAYEVVIFRNNGESHDRVWEGPITLLTYEAEQVVIQAKDIMVYAYRRIIKQPMSDSGNSPTAGRSVVARAADIIQNIFAPDDPNVLAYLKVITSGSDAKQYRSLPAYSRTGYEEIDDMAANAGLDYTAVGRSIVVWGTKNRIGTLPEFRDKDLGNSPIVSTYGMSMANRYVVSDGNGVWGEATRLDEDGMDEANGLIEMLSSTWASDSTVDTGTFTQEGIAEVSQSFAQSAERSIASRYPVPVVVRIPDNTKVNPDTVISIQHLVPGVVIPLHSVSTLREVRANQKLDSVKVIEENGTETITITLSPFSREDNEIEAVE